MALAFRRNKRDALIVLIELIELYELYELTELYEGERYVSVAFIRRQTA